MFALAVSRLNIRYLNLRERNCPLPIAALRPYVKKAHVCPLASLPVPQAPSRLGDLHDGVNLPPRGNCSEAAWTQLPRVAWEGGGRVMDVGVASGEAR